ncbi:hypothetical protein IQ07DRAFT_648965 [Pyrenochaeta sp. DS3sAY3a]|nr:hypothetical protein IQ07DRAFT_648965 [Pyrenochaeta sp. DS3sAY3a]
MVAEALATIGLVGNIVQFVDFSFKLFGTASSIRDSISGSSQHIQDVEEVAEEIHKWCSKIVPLQLRCSNGLILQNKSLIELAGKCQDIATEILSAVSVWKANNPKSKWDCFKSAMTTMWNESRINEMKARLESCRVQLVLELSRLQSDCLSGVYLLLHEIDETNQRLHANLSNPIETLGRELRSSIKLLHRDLSNPEYGKSNFSNTQHLDSTQNSNTEGSKVQTGESSTARPLQVKLHERNTLATTLVHCSSTISEYAVFLVLLDSLDFDQRRGRYTTIHHAHPGTFSWVFPSRFEAWLQSDHPIFWISGKPGSGKSTLMKFLVGNSNTLEALSLWSGSAPLVVVDYYFWINGSDLQRSHDGLLRALLYEILRQDPSAAKLVFPEAWKSIEERLATGTSSSSKFCSHTWERSTLLEACQRLSTSENLRTKFCLFIDGLDEFQGDHEELIQTVRDLAKLNVKLCVASRPWNAFEEAFGADVEHKIYLQDFNKPDMEFYIEQKLTNQPNFRILEHDQGRNIVDEIVEKAKGVFLWVFLVVRSLNEGLRNQDSFSLLQKRLREFPSDLDQFFRHMFLSLEPIYRSHLSHMFQVALRASAPLHLLAYWFLEGNLNIETMPVNSPQYQNTTKMEETMAIRINGRCKGLMEVSNEGVDFLHRTVKDFFETSEINALLIEWQQPGFNPDLALCTILLAEFKCSPPTISKLYYVCLILTLAIRHYGKESKESAQRQVELFEQTFADHLQFQPAAHRAAMWKLLARIRFAEIVAPYQPKLLTQNAIKKKAIQESQAPKSRRSLGRRFKALLGKPDWA